MKKIINKLAVMAFFMMPIFIQAQSPLDKVAEKYNGKQGFNVVNISKDMLQVIFSVAEEKDTATQAFKRAVSHMNGMKVIDCNCDLVKPAQCLAFYNEASALFPPAIYKELITGNDGFEFIRFLTKKDSKGQITELIMLEQGAKEIVAFSITGIIDLATVSKIAKSMNIKGMDTLDNYKDKSKK